MVCFKIFVTMIKIKVNFTKSNDDKVQALVTAFSQSKKGKKIRKTETKWSTDLDMLLKGLIPHNSGYYHKTHQQPPRFVTHPYCNHCFLVTRFSLVDHLFWWSA